METKEKDTMEQFLQKQPYRLTTARHSLGIHQMRVMTRVVEALQPFMSFKVEHGDKKDIWIQVKVAELVVGNNVKPLREALDGLMKKTVRIMYYIEEDANCIEVGMPIIKEYKYEHRNDKVELQISGHLLPQMIDLARGYTKYSVEIAFNTSSPNVFKLYQYVSHFRDRKRIQCNVYTLRKWLQIEEKYAMPAKIKERILNPAIKELKEKADVWFDVAERVTEGRKMIGWKFNIYTKKEAKTTSDIPALPPLQPTEQAQLTQKQLRQRLVESFGLSAWQAVAILEKVPKEEINRTLYEISIAKSDGKVRNIGGYAAKIFEKKYNLGF